MSIRSRIINNPIGPAIVPLVGFVAAILAALASQVARTNVTVLRVAGIVACLSFATCLVAMRFLSKAPDGETVGERVPRVVFTVIVLIGIIAMIGLAGRIATADPAWVIEHVAG